MKESLERSAITPTLREYLSCLAIICFSISLWFKDYLLHGYTFLCEVGQMLWADWVMVHHLFLREQAVGWNPYVLFGTNFVGREGFFNPLGLGNMLGLLFSNPKTGFMFLTMLFLALMGVSMYAFIRTLGIEHRFALLGSVMYTLAPKWADDAYHGPRFVIAYAVLPCVVRVILRIHRHNFRSKKDFVLLATLLALMYCAIGIAFLMICLYMLGALFAYLLIRYLRESNETWKTLIPRVILYSFLSASLFLGMVSHILLPFIQNYMNTERSLYIPSPGFANMHYLGLIFPWVKIIFADGIYDMRYHSVFPLIVSNPDFYFGILVVPVLLYAVVNRMWDKTLLFFLMMPLAWLVLWNEWVIKAFPLLPLLEHFTKGIPSLTFGNIILVFCFATSTSAVLSMQAKIIQEKKSWPRWLTGLNQAVSVLYILAAALFLLGAIVVNTSARAYFWPHISNKYAIFLFYYFHEKALLFISLFSARALIIWLYYRRKLFHRFGFILTMALMILDFLLCFRIWYPFNDMDDRYSTTYAANAFVVQHTNPLDRIGAFNYQLAPMTQYHDFLNQPAPENYSALKDQISHLSYKGFIFPVYEPGLSYFPLTVPRSFYGFHESIMPAYFWDYEIAMNSGNPRYQRQSWTGLWDPHSKLLDIAGINYIYWFQRLNDHRLLQVGEYPGYYGTGYIYKNTKAVPRAYIAARVEYFSDRQTLLKRLNDPAFDPLSTVTTEDPSLTLTTGLSKSAPSAKTLIELYAPHKIRIKTRAHAPSVLVLNDMYFPNWFATVNGTSVPISRVNATFRGVVVPAGESLVEFRYHNPYLKTGVRLSGTLWLIVLSYFLISYLRLRPKRGE